MTSRPFKVVADELATERGGFTLWLGAGAASAATSGTLPTWQKLATDLDARIQDADFPSRLEKISQALGHAVFRKRLRQLLIESVTIDRFNLETVLQQAVLAARAGTIVSFNVEYLTSAALCLLRGGENFIPRTFHERSPLSVDATVTSSPGVAGAPIYFPHGLLQAGNVVLTRSEYDRHLGTFAMATAVHLCVGADLVVLGMSFADSYLREAVLQNRRWIRDVFWFAQPDDFAYSEWARVAGVTRIEVDYDTLWSSLAESILEHDTETGTLRSWVAARRPQLTDFLTKLLEHHRRSNERLLAQSKEVLHRYKNDESKLRIFANYCIDTGHVVPVEIAQACQI